MLSMKRPIFEQSFAMTLMLSLSLSRCTGLITGIGDADPVRWPGSKWRCLLV